MDRKPKPRRPLPRQLRNCVVVSNGRKVHLPEVEKVIISVRDEAKRQHQASVDLTVENIKNLKKKIRRRE